MATSTQVFDAEDSRFVLDNDGRTNSSFSRHLQNTILGNYGIRFNYQSLVEVNQANI